VLKSKNHSEKHPAPILSTMGGAPTFTPALSSIE